MKKIVFIIPALILFLFGSCSEEFEPKIDFEQQYALFCIINGDTLHQSAVITKSFDVSGFDPSTYAGDPYVSGAEIKIKYSGKEYIFRDSVTSPVSGPHPSTLYYVDSLMPDADKIMEIEALLPGGIQLKGATKTPKSNNLTFSRDTVRSDTYIKDQENGLFFFWRIIGGEDYGMMYLPVLKIYYVIRQNGTEELKEIKVPVRFFNQNNQLIPHYPELSGYKELNITMDAVNRIMNMIGENIADKTTIYIKEAVLHLLILDSNLAPYYQSVESLSDGYTVLLDQIDYTNINGGRGVFGSYYKRTHRLSFDPEFVYSFGYRVYRN